MSLFSFFQIEDRALQININLFLNFYIVQKFVLIFPNKERKPKPSNKSQHHFGLKPKRDKGLYFSVIFYTNSISLIK